MPDVSGRSNGAILLSRSFDVEVALTLLRPVSDVIGEQLLSLGELLAPSSASRPLSREHPQGDNRRRLVVSARWPGR